MRPALLVMGALAAAGTAQADGAAGFAETCAACHGEAGVGIPGIAPPLARPAFWAAFGDKAPTYLAGVMAAGMGGKLTVEGQMYVGVIMPSQAHVGAAELAEIGTYVLQGLGGTTAVVDAETVEAAIKAPPTHADLRAMRPES